MFLHTARASILGSAILAAGTYLGIYLDVANRRGVELGAGIAGVAGAGVLPGGVRVLERGCIGLDMYSRNENPSPLRHVTIYPVKTQGKTTI